MWCKVKGVLIVKYQIIKNCSSNKDFLINAEEEMYFEKLYLKLTDCENKSIKLYRMSNGAIETYFRNYPLGKLKLQGRKHWMQVYKSLYKVDVIEGTVDDFIKKIDDVVLYIRKYCK